MRLVLLITAVVIAIEVVGALVTGSLALFSDAGHLLTDATVLVLALSASLVATLPPNSRRTFGYHRAEILAGLANSLVLLGICVVLAVFGVRRLVDPEHVDGVQLIVFASVALAANGLGVALLAGRRGESLNMRAAFTEVLGDALGAAAAVVAGIVIATTGYLRADPIASLLIAVLIVPRALSLARDAVGVLLEEAPADVSLEELRERLCRVDGVIDVHDLHAWTITSGMPAMSAHVTVTDGMLDSGGVGPVLDRLCACTASDFGIDHATFQIEPASHIHHEDLGDIPHP